MAEKNKISQFEYAIREVIDVDTPGAGELDKYQPITDIEELELRKENLRKQASILKIIEQ